MAKIEDPVEALLEIVRFYARMRPGVIDILEAAGQERFKISIKSLRRAAGRMGFYGVDAIIEYILRDDKSLERLRRLGVEIIVDDGRVWVEVPSMMLKEFRGEAGKGRA